MIIAVPDFVEELEPHSHAVYLRRVAQRAWEEGPRAGMEPLRLYLAYCALGGLAVLGELGAAEAAATRVGLQRMFALEGGLHVGQTPWLRLSAERGPDLVSLFFLAAALDLVDATELLPTREVLRWLEAFEQRAQRRWDLRAVYAFACLSERFDRAVAPSVRVWAIAGALACRGFDGGYAFEPGCESHAAATFLCLAVLCLLGEPAPQRLLSVGWLAARQADWGFAVG